MGVWVSYLYSVKNSEQLSYTKYFDPGNFYRYRELSTNGPGGGMPRVRYVRGVWWGNGYRTCIQSSVPRSFRIQSILIRATFIGTGKLPTDGPGGGVGVWCVKGGVVDIRIAYS